MERKRGESEGVRGERMGGGQSEKGNEWEMESVRRERGERVRGKGECKCEEGEKEREKE